EILEHTLRSEVAKVIGVQSGESVDPKKGLMAQGLDSLLTVELRNRLKRLVGPRLAEKIPSTLFFDYPTLQALGGHLLEELVLEETPQPSRAAPRTCSSSHTEEAIAIVGMGCRFPGGASDLESFWRLLANGVDAVTEIPKERWNIEDFYSPDPAT